MLSSQQLSLEASYSGTYVQNYLDCVENLPNDLQRHLTRIRELDCSYRAYLRDIELQTEKLNLSKKKVKYLMRIKTALIAAQDVGDEKLAAIQVLQDIIELRTRRLDNDFKNLDFGKDEVASEPKELQISVNTSTNNNIITASNAGERQSKRARRTRHENVPSDISLNTSETVATEQVVKSASATSIASTSQKKTNSAQKGSGKKKKRKATRTQTTSQNQRVNDSGATTGGDESPTHPEDEQAIDPDEPTYCLCDQISFGEMILCDNDLCPIEWFHFSCVFLTSKPKGKWFCPKCRGDRPNVMKPKQQFLKELERYNKEKEEKT